MVKPSISAGSRDTARWADPADVLTHATELAAAGRTAMVQPYLASVDDAGETAMLFLGGAFSHAVRKGPLLAREGVRQDRDSRGDLSPAVPTTAQRDVAQSVFDAIPGLVGLDTHRCTHGSTWSRTPRAAGAARARADRAELFLPQAPEAAATLVRAVEAELAR